MHIKNAQQNCADFLSHFNIKIDSRQINDLMVTMYKTIYSHSIRKIFEKLDTIEGDFNLRLAGWL
jgi:hypothetical protein